MITTENIVSPPFLGLLIFWIAQEYALTVTTDPALAGTVALVPALLLTAACYALVFDSRRLYLAIRDFSVTLAVALFIFAVLHTVA